VSAGVVDAEYCTHVGLFSMWLIVTSSVLRLDLEDVYFDIILEVKTEMEVMQIACLMTA
jgi:hypothetical protein